MYCIGLFGSPRDHGTLYFFYHVGNVIVFRQFLNNILHNINNI